MSYGMTTYAPTLIDADSIRANIDGIRGRIRKACARVGRNEHDVRLLLATKTVPPDGIRVALEYGERLIGENRTQELVAKAAELEGLAFESHFIGHLQSNKIKATIDLVTCIQSLDRMSTAEKLNRQLARRERQMDVFLQFNTSGESSKFGAPPESAVDFARQVAALPHLRIKGLMTIGLLAPMPVLSRPSLRRLRELQMDIQDAAIAGVEARELSMGMSMDLDVAIEEGATMVRVGSDVFGKRATPPGFFWDEDDAGDRR